MFHDSENIPVSKLREGETAGYPDTPLLSCDILFSSIISTGSERGNGGSGPKDDGPALVYDKTVHHGKNIRFLVRQSYQLLTCDGERVDGWPANLYFPEHLLLEIRSVQISYACALGLHDAKAEDVKKNQRFRTKHLRIPE